MEGDASTEKLVSLGCALFDGAAPQILIAEKKHCTNPASEAPRQKYTKQALVPARTVS